MPAKPKKKTDGENKPEVYYGGVRLTLDPTIEQEQKFLSALGGVRFSYNTMLARVIERLDKGEDLNCSFFSLSKEWNSIKDEVAPWWKENTVYAYTSGTAQVADALKIFFDSKKGKRKGKRVGFPKFKKRSTPVGVEFACNNNDLRIDNYNHIRIPRIGNVHFFETKLARRLSKKLAKGEARILAGTLSKFRGRWVIALRVEYLKKPAIHAKPGSIVGIDLGVKDWIVCATPDGEEVIRVARPEKMKTLDKKKRRLQRRGKNKKIGSNRYRKHLARVAKVDYAMANLRDDVLHKATTELAKRFETVVLEDLNVAGMKRKGGARKKGLNRVIGEASLSKIRQMLEYKTLWNGGQVVTVDRFYPSSKTCSGCGSVKAKLLLSERTYCCEGCGIIVDRDLNTSINLAKAGRALVSARGVAGKTKDSLSTVNASDCEARSLFEKGSSEPQGSE